MENIAEEAAERQHIKTLYGLTKTLYKDPGRMETLSLKKMKYSQDGQSILRKCLIEKNQNKLVIKGTLFPQGAKWVHRNGPLYGKHNGQADTEKAAKEKEKY